MPDSLAKASRAGGRRSYFPVSNSTSEIFTFRPRGVSVVGKMRLNCSSRLARSCSSPARLGLQLVALGLRRPALAPQLVAPVAPSHRPERDLEPLVRPATLPASSASPPVAVRLPLAVASRPRQRLLPELALCVEPLRLSAVQPLLLPCAG